MQPRTHLRRHPFHHPPPPLQPRPAARSGIRAGGGGARSAGAAAGATVLALAGVGSGSGMGPCPLPPPPPRQQPSENRAPRDGALFGLLTRTAIRSFHLSCPLLLSAIFTRTGEARSSKNCGMLIDTNNGRARRTKIPRKARFCRLYQCCTAN